MNGVCVSNSNILKTGALSIIYAPRRTSKSSSVSSSSTDSVPSSISKNAGHPLPFLCYLTAVKLGKYVSQLYKLVYVLFEH